jgi:GNAT superfamily N-acetyltransferase
MRPISRQRDTFAYRIARPDTKGEDLYVSGLIDRLDGEFNEWWGESKTVDGKDPITNWSAVEVFLKEKYPQAHSPGFFMGYEHAGPTLDGKAEGHPYETGPEAVAKHGYDPKEVAAAMLLLHSQAHPYRSQSDQWMMADLDRLTDIYRTRQRMQQAYDERQKTAAPVNQNVVTQLGDEFHQWWEDSGYTWDPYERGDDDERGPMGDWPTIEEFLEERYPAAHRGLMMGQEIARPLLDGVGRHDEDPDPRNFNMLQVTHGDNVAPYETGPEAQAQHGYDPREVAAAFLLLHNKTHPLRGYRAGEDQARLDEITQARNAEFDNADIDVLHDIAQKRTKMQRAAMPAPAPKGLRFEYDPNFIHPHADYLGRVQAYVDDHPVGHLEWMKDGNPLSAITDRKPGEVSFIYVHPNYRRHSIASEMFDWVKENAAPDLHHSQRRTDLGDKWVGYEQQRVAAVADDTIDRLRGEFHDWWNTDGTSPKKGQPLWTPVSSREAMGYWGNMERFLSARYPAASRDSLYMGMEQVEPLLHQRDGQWGGVPRNADPYETGRKAVEKHGYDPAEIAAGMLYLHNDGRPGREQFQHVNRNLILKIIRNRRKMQKEYDSKPRQLELPLDDVLAKAAAVLDFAQRLAMPRMDAYDLDSIPTQGPDQTPVLPGPWYHASPHKLQVGDILDPHHKSPGGRVTYDGPMTPRDNWVFLHPSADYVRRFGDNLYQVEPLDEGPWSYNEQGGLTGHVSPRARIIKIIPNKGRGSHPTPGPGAFTDYRDYADDIEFQPYEYPKRKTAMPAEDAYDGNWKNRKTSPPVVGPFYHSSDHDLPDGTILLPNQGESKFTDDYERRPGWKERTKWVWMELDPSGGWGEHTYEVEPMDEGPWPWNGDGRTHGYTSPRARIIRKMTPEDQQELMDAFVDRMHEESRHLYARRTAMPAPLPDDVTFKYHHTNDSIPEGYNGVNQGGSHTFLAPAVAAYKNDKPVAYVEWWPTDKYPNAAKHYRFMDKGKPGEVYYIYVHPNHRRNSIASEMFRWAKDNVEPDLHHSPKKSELGTKWVSYEESTPELARAAAVIRKAQALTE